tara:strand:- start:1316 stop:1759 length:444 start_codon:yes stop_codon:yes gene_type:complete
MDKTLGDKDIVIRKLKQDDLTGVIELLKSNFNGSFTKNQISSAWLKYVNQDFNHSVVAICESKIVGHGSIVISKRLRGGNLGVIEDIIVHSNYRKKNVGKSIVNFLFDVAKDNGCYKVVLQCEEKNFNFYKKCNFETSGISMQRFLK